MSFCSDFDSGFHKKENNFSWNHKDEQGLHVFTIALLGAASLFASIFIFIKRRSQGTSIWTKSSMRILLGGLVLFTLLAFVFVLFIGICDPIQLVYVVSMLIANEVRTPPVLDAYSFFPGASELEENITSLQHEIATMDTCHLKLTRDTFGGANANIGKDVREQDGDLVGWRIFSVSSGKHINAYAKQQLPVLVSLIEKYNKYVQSCAISVLPAQTKIPQHVGYYKGVLRYMLAIEVPKNRDQVFICVNDNKVNWTEGKSIMFDDCFPHKVFNNTAEKRVVIYMDIVRPLSSRFLNQLNVWMLEQITGSAFVKKEVLSTEKIQKLD